MGVRSAILLMALGASATLARAAPMTNTVQELLRERIGRFRRGGYVFLDSEGRERTSRRFRSRISQRTVAAATAAGLDGVTFHTLRHTAGSSMAQAGLAEVAIAERLGHATTATPRRHMHLRPEHLRAGAIVLESTLDGTSRGPVDSKRTLQPKRTTEGAKRPDVIPSNANNLGG